VIRRGARRDAATTNASRFRDTARFRERRDTPALWVRGPAAWMVTLAEDFRHLITGEFAVLAAILAVRAIFFDFATALRMSALFLGHTNLRPHLTQTSIRSVSPRARSESRRQSGTLVHAHVPPGRPRLIGRPAIDEPRLVEYAGPADL
jgi:hypothetical protein